LQVVVAATAVIAGRAGGRVLVDAGSGVAHADHDGLVDGGIGGAAVEGLVDAPLVAAEGLRGIEEVLAVVHVDHRVGGGGVLRVGGRQVGGHRPVVVEVAGAE